MAKTDNHVFVDFETKSKRDIDDGAAAYAADPSTDILLIAYAIEDQEVICFDINEEPEKLIPLYEAIRNGFILVAHNVLFEAFIIKYVGRPKYNWPSMKYSQFMDTMHMAGRAGLPLSLADSAKALKVEDKLDTGKLLIQLFSIPQPNGQFIEMNSRPKQKVEFMEYCRQDVIVSREIWRNLPEWKDSERLDVAFDLRCNFHGVPIDVETAKRIHNNVLEIQSNFGTRADELTKGVITKMTQVQRLKQWVHKYVSPEIPNCAADTIIDLLDGKYGDLDPITEELLLMRQHSGKSSTGKYYRYINSQVDEMIYGMIISFGAHTGRTISKLLNLNNLPKPSIKYESMQELIDDLANLSVDEINTKYSSYLKAASTAIRGIITAPHGKSLLVADYASIEARLVFWLANSLAGLLKYHEGIDLYKDMASTVFSTHYDNVIDDERWVGKQIILGSGFGLGWRGFQNTCRNYGRELDDQLCQDSINSYREAYPEVVELWDELDRQSMNACKTGKITYAACGRIAFKTFQTKSGVVFLLMRLPSGRFISYPDVKIVKTVTPWGASRKAISYKKLNNGMWVRETTYGGKITENAIQGIARDLMYYGAQNAQSFDYQTLFTVYDEIIALKDEDKADIKEFERLICELPKWADGIPLEAEGKILKRYQKL